MKKFTRLRVVPANSAKVSCDIFATVVSGFPSLPYCASSNNARASRFSVELKSWSTKSDSTFRFRFISFFGITTSVVGFMTDAEVIRKGEPLLMQPSPTKSPTSSRVMTASFPAH
jgi:hypothetical protein